MKHNAFDCIPIPHQDLFGANSIFGVVGFFFLLQYVNLCHGLGDFDHFPTEGIRNLIN